MKWWPFGKSADAPAADITSQPSSLPVISLEDMSASMVSPLQNGATSWGWNDGEKYPGGYGVTEILLTDYWTLRLRSAELFKKNLYARGLLRRLVTNVINTGLTLESFPDEEILGYPEDGLTEWSERVEARNHIWTQNARICDYQERRTFQELQQDCKLEAMIEGDVLVIMRQHPLTKLPQIQLVQGSKIRTPFGQPLNLPDGHRIVHGVQLDERGRHHGFWVCLDPDGLKAEFIPAYGQRTGRRMAWLVYGTDKRMDEVRGEPLLSLVLQSLKDMDRYRDAALRKAVMNSVLAMWVEKTEDKPGTQPLTGGATRRDKVIDTQDSKGPRKLNFAGMLPGVAIETLQTGEKIQTHGSGAEVQFGPFEESIVQAIAWANQIPPEILKLAFSNNYSASQAAINEFKMFLNKERTDFGHDFCQPVYVEWLISETLLGAIEAPGLLEAWRDPSKYDVFGAWVDSDWSGAIKPSTDLVKQARGMKMIVAEGWSTNERASREITGTKFRKNIKRLKRENQLKVEAAEPLADFEQRYGRSADDFATQESIARAVADGLSDAMGADS